jgi:anti-sigma regulatory factor (Ser/Thr protein kinase)
MPVLPEVTVPLNELVPPAYRHYFNGHPSRPRYTIRRYDFGSSPQYMPLVRAYLDTCAAQQNTDYRYLFTLLGSELANNALRHSKSGLPGGSYSLLAERHRNGMTLTCRDQGELADRMIRHDQREHLVPALEGLNLAAESGRGLAMVDAFATRWGDNGQPSYRKVWFHLAYDLTDSLWNTDL